MELLTAEERRTRKVYRWVFIGGLAVVVAIAVWLARPPRPLDLRFLKALNPKVGGRAEEGYGDITFTQPPAEVEKLLDAHLNEATHWRKDTRGGVGYTTYSSPGWSSASISVMAFGPKVKGTMVSVHDPRRVVIWPR